jgi:diguanylate cyclase (GGDEF)-like protein/hemerythrin-like metal-binding protein
MESFHWGKYYETEIASVDAQHHKLVDLINELGNAVTESNGRNKDLEAIIVRLADYAKYHFSDEEVLMESAGLDPRHIRSHKKAHHHFFEEIELITSDAQECQLEKTRSLLEYLVNWLGFHILGSDQSMAHQIRAISEGMTPELAFENYAYGDNDAVKPMLKAVGYLFNQLTSSNQKLRQSNLSLEKRVVSRTEDLLKANQALEHISLSDPLTDLPNRRSAMNQLQNNWAIWLANKTPVTLIMIDADHFKEVNDKFGHEAGDCVLKMLARCLKQAARTDDLVCRLGGDEFLVLCPKTELEGGLLLAEKLRASVESLRVSVGKGKFWNSSVSLGVASSSEPVRTMEELLKNSDQGMYMAKVAGKNCVRHC